MTTTSPDDIPIRDRIGRLTRTSALTGKPVVISEDDAVAVLTHHWPWIEAHIREQVAQEIEQATVTVDGGTYPMQTARTVERALTVAAAIARGTDTNRSFP